MLGINLSIMKQKLLFMEDDMKEIWIETFHDLNEAVMWQENLLWEEEMKGGLKGEILQLPDGSWRVSVIRDNYQLELDI